MTLPSKTGKCHSDEQRGAEGLSVGSVRKCDVKTFGSLWQQFQIQNFHRLKVLTWDADSQDGWIIQDAHILKILLSGQSASRFKLQ